MISFFLDPPMGVVCLFLVYMYISFFPMAYAYVDERMSEIFLKRRMAPLCVAVRSMIYPSVSQRSFLLSRLTSTPICPGGNNGKDRDDRCLRPTTRLIAVSSDVERVGLAADRTLCADLSREILLE
ncbi:uncharacterized protein K489DRAFT_223142 [Dissoconium aciculare CBS 342.82]|uniref:Uncharacterized protein n=1 Tax=Dissoconium aciculare CBS 342.82 TaxID=1314786 RepID=A0A6J3M836_9PEZI|nr:uncharacterized protein K489DRAFT_223142 [Dissoconium aciculare CBS 342.82]KAF1823012.1 hypothetical protein K489DRAFT_223142 [Dissoconium aciculare CBS 342.82]